MILYSNTCEKNLDEEILPDSNNPLTEYEYILFAISHR